MQRFTCTLLILIAALIYTACVSDSASGNNQPEKIPAPATVEKTTPQPEETPPPVKEKAPTPAPKLTPPPITTQKPIPPPAPKPAPVPAPQPTLSPPPQPVNTAVQKVVTPTPPPPTPTPIPTGGGIMTFDNRTFDYGYIEEGTVVNHTFKFKNTGTTPINILRAEASCGCTHPTYPFLAIEPGKTGEIGVRFDSKGKLGKSKSTITLLTDTRPANQELFLTGTVTPPKKEAKEEKKQETSEAPKKEAKEEEKVNEKISETIKNQPTPKSDSLSFTPRGPRKLPKGIPPKKGN